MTARHRRHSGRADDADDELPPYAAAMAAAARNRRQRGLVVPAGASPKEVDAVRRAALSNPAIDWIMFEGRPTHPAAAPPAKHSKTARRRARR